MPSCITAVAPQQRPHRSIDKFSLRLTCAAVKPPNAENAVETIAFLCKVSGFSALSDKIGLAIAAPVQSIIL
jgi:hypothetical protein